MKGNKIMKRIAGIVWIILLSIIMILNGCSYSTKSKSNEEDDIKTQHGPVYKLVYDMIFDCLLCFPSLDQDAELTELYINDKCWSDQNYTGEVCVGNVPKGFFDLRIVSYDKYGEIVGEEIYNNVLIYDAEGKDELGDIPENTQYLIVYNTGNLKNIQSLKKVKRLRGLSIIFGNSLQDISPIENLTDLEVINLNSNQLIDDLSALKNLTNLTMLSISGNKIKDIAALKNLDELRYLSIGDNEIEDISVLRNLEKLEWINLSSNKIKDVTPLSNLKNISYLNICRNEIENYSPLDEAGIEYNN